MSKTPTLYTAIGNLLAPLWADKGDVIHDLAPDTPVIIKFGEVVVHSTTVEVFQDLDRAHVAAFDAKVKRDERRSRGSLL